MQYVGIEAGGTKFVLVRGTNPNDLQDRTVIPTQTPEQTLPEVINYIRQAQQHGKISAIGAAFFGPLQLDPKHPHYGHITSTPKQAWQNYDVVGLLAQHFDVPIGFDTDVNATALAEHYWGAAQGLSDFIYMTVGTGIGCGAMVANTLLHGAMHPEMGHIMIHQDHQRDPFGGVCPFHGNCLEGLASGPSIKERHQVTSALDLASDHPAWDLEADYLSQALATYSCVLSPKRIIIGGGVMRQPQLLHKIKPKLIAQLNGYIDNQYILDDNYVVKPSLGENAGACGALALAQQALINQSQQQREPQCPITT